MCFCIMYARIIYFVFFFFNDTATTEIYTLSLHDALPIFLLWQKIPIAAAVLLCGSIESLRCLKLGLERDRKSTRLNSSHGYISYAVFCLKKKKTERYISLASTKN